MSRLNEGIAVLLIKLRRCPFASAASCREVVRCCLAISLWTKQHVHWTLRYVSAVSIIFSTVCGSCHQPMALTWSKLVWIHVLGSRHWPLQACSPMVLRELILKGLNKFTWQKRVWEGIYTHDIYTRMYVCMYVCMYVVCIYIPEKRGRKPGISLNGDRMVESMGGSHRHIWTENRWFR